MYARYNRKFIRDTWEKRRRSSILEFIKIGESKLRFNSGLPIKRE
jgi:hypothetical protein